MRLLIIDRDGVILRHVAPYILRWSDVVTIPGVMTMMQQLTLARRHIAVVTNQSPVERGLITMDFVSQVNSYIRASVGAAEETMSFHVCPHRDSTCMCRKPRPGLLFDALRLHDTEPTQSVMVGDQASDMAAALAAGLKTRVQVVGRGACPGPVSADATQVISHADLAREFHSWLCL